jgi:hypothetical protein
VSLGGAASSFSLGVANSDGRQVASEKPSNGEGHPTLPRGLEQRENRLPDYPTTGTSSRGGGSPPQWIWTVQSGLGS